VTKKFHLHSELSGTFVNGPSVTGRYCFWVQYCPFACPGCFNVETWGKAGGYYKTVDELYDSILSSGCDGLTISGGEPMLQRDALYDLLLKLEPHVLSGQLSHGIICYTGFTMTELLKLRNSKDLFPLIDVLVDGRYVESLKTSDSIAGSSNQGFNFSNKSGRGSCLVNLSSLEEIDKGVEIHSSDNKKVVQITGFPNIDRTLLESFGLTVKQGKL
jgi:anaerobic ribonucleoside-triphosphate reductase activating protein